MPVSYNEARLRPVVFVDDVLAIGDDGYINDFKAKIGQKYKIRDSHYLLARLNTCR